MHNLDKILEHLEKCKPYEPQNPIVVRRATFTGWALFLIGSTAAFAVKIAVASRPLTGLSRAVANCAKIGLVSGSLLLVLAFAVQIVVGVQTTLRERTEPNPKTSAQRRLEVDEDNVRFLLGQPDKSLEYARCYLRQMNSRTGEWITHVFGSAAPALPLLAVLVAFSRDLGVIHWLEDAFTQGHSPDPLILRLIFFALALAVLTVATAFGLAAEQRKNSYRSGLIEMAITLKNLADKPFRGRKRPDVR